MAAGTLGGGIPAAEGHQGGGGGLHGDPGHPGDRRRVRGGDHRDAAADDGCSGCGLQSLPMHRTHSVRRRLVGRDGGTRPHRSGATAGGLPPERLQPTHGGRPRSVDQQIGRHSFLAQPGGGDLQAAEELRNQLRQEGKVAGRRDGRGDAEARSGPEHEAEDL